MGTLTDILSAGGFGGNDFTDTWNQTDAAGEFEPLPSGEYVGHATRGELDSSSKGTPRYQLAFTIIEGPGGDTTSAGRLVWHHLYLTPAALPMAKRDLLKLGIDDPAKLERPLPPGIRCRVKVAIHKDDDGIERNRVKWFKVMGIDEPVADPFAPRDSDYDRPPSQAATAQDPAEEGRRKLPEAYPRWTSEDTHYDG